MFYDYDYDYDRNLYKSEAHLEHPIASEIRFLVENLCLVAVLIHPRQGVFPCDLTFEIWPQQKLSYRKQIARLIRRGHLGL